jgi:hypothetical protein
MVVSFYQRKRSYRLFFHYLSDELNFSFKRSKYFCVLLILKSNNHLIQWRNDREQMIDYGRMYVSNCRHFDLFFWYMLVRNTYNTNRVVGIEITSERNKKKRRKKRRTSSSSCEVFCIYIINLIVGLLFLLFSLVLGRMSNVNIHWTYMYFYH